MGCVVEFFRKATHLPLPLQARDLNLDQQTNTEGASRFAFLKLTPKQTEMRATEFERWREGLCEKEVLDSGCQRIKACCGHLKVGADRWCSPNELLSLFSLFDLRCNWKHACTSPNPVFRFDLDNLVEWKGNEAASREARHWKIGFFHPSKGFRKSRSAGCRCSSQVRGFVEAVAVNARHWLASCLCLYCFVYGSLCVAFIFFFLYFSSKIIQTK